MVAPDRLSAIPLFSALPPAVQGVVAERLTARSFRAQEKLFKEGDAGDGLYLLVSGKVAIQKILDRQRETYKTLTIIAPGEFFGEMALLEKEPRSASAVALTDGEVLVLSVEDFNKWFSQDARLPVRLLLPFVSTLSARLRDTTRDMTIFMEVGRILVQDVEPKETAAQLLDVLSHPFDGEVESAFYLWDAYDNGYIGAASFGGWPENMLGFRSGVDPLLQWMTAKGECLLSLDWEKDDRFSGDIRAAWPPFRSLLAAPVPGPRRPAGFVLLGHKTEAEFFTAAHRRTLAHVVNLVSPVLENAFFREERRAEDRLRRSRFDPR